MIDSPGPDIKTISFEMIDRGVFRIGEMRQGLGIIVFLRYIG